MNIRELKDAILSNNISEMPLILKHTNNRYICNQYVKEIAKNRNLEIKRVEKLSETFSDDSFFDDKPSFLFVIDTSKFDENITAENKNVIVIAEKIPNNLTIDFIDIPALLDWQIEEYVKMRLPGLAAQEVKWICDITKHDIYRIDQECQKLENFPKNQQSIIFNQLSKEGGYSDLNPLVIFDFTTAIMNRDMRIVDETLKNLRVIDVEATGLITILCKQFRTLIDTQFSSVWSPSMGCSEKQFYYFKSHPNRNYSQDQIIKIYDFLTGLDYEIKSGNMTFDAENRVNNALATVYITTKVLTM